jgi:hypothetical protein
MDFQAVEFASIDLADGGGSRSDGWIEYRVRVPEEQQQAPREPAPRSSEWLGGVRSFHDGVAAGDGDDKDTVSGSPIGRCFAWRTVILIFCSHVIYDFVCAISFLSHFITPADRSAPPRRAF